MSSGAINLAIDFSGSVLAIAYLCYASYGKRNKSFVMAQYEERLKKQVVQQTYDKLFGKKALVVGWVGLVFFLGSIFIDWQDISPRSRVIALVLGLTIGALASWGLYSIMFSKKR